MGRSGGGGSRSSGGFGGGRSSGGFSGGGRHSSPRGSSRPSSGMYRHRPSPRMHSGPRMHGGPIFGRPYRSRPVVYTRVGGGRSGSFITGLILVIFFAMMFISIFAGTSSSNNVVISNTTQRSPITSAVYKTDWYEDQLYWIKNKNIMIEGMEDFYDETGIQPYVLFVSYDDQYWSQGTLNTTVATEYLESYYDSHFKDEGHFIFAYFACEGDDMSEMNGEFRYLSGYAVDSVMDNEAIQIFWGEFEDHYYDLSLSIEEMISGTFSDTAKTIMSKPTNMWDFMKIGIVVVGGIGVVYLVYRMIKTKAQREKEKEEYTKEILDKPLDTFGTDTSDLEEKYK